MEERQVYVSFENEEYKANKAELLRCKVALVNLQKNITMLSATRSSKRRLLAQLLKQVSSTGFVVSRLNDKMPDSSLPKHIRDKMPKAQHKNTKEKMVKEKVKEIIEAPEMDIGGLDRELLELNRRIKALG